LDVSTVYLDHQVHGLENVGDDVGYYVSINIIAGWWFGT
jgi:hypothetical protein